MTALPPEAARFLYSCFTGLEEDYPATAGDFIRAYHDAHCQAAKASGSEDDAGLPCITVTMSDRVATLRINAEFDADAVDPHMKLLEAAGGIDVHISSLGGTCDATFGLVSLLTSKSYTCGTVPHKACSGAAFVLQGCTNRRMAQGARLMFHSPSQMVYGTEKELLAAAGKLRTYNRCLKEIVRKRVTDAKVCDWLMDGKDHYIGASEALKLGLIDEILPPVPKPLQDRTTTNGQPITPKDQAAKEVLNGLLWNARDQFADLNNFQEVLERFCRSAHTASAGR